MIDDEEHKRHELIRKIEALYKLKLLDTCSVYIVNLKPTINTQEWAIKLLKSQLSNELLGIGVKCSKLKT